MSGAATAQRLKLRLFVEGVELPIIAAAIQVAPNSPIVASVQIPPLPEGTKFLPRSLVHIFFMDFNEVDSPLLRDADAAVASIEAGGVTPTMFERSALRARNVDGTFNQEFIEATGIEDMRNERYKLLFCGEAIGFGWTKNVNSRSLVLKCMDLSNYWDYAYQWNNTDLFGPGVKAMFSGGGTSLFTDFLDSPGGVLARIIQQPSSQYPGLKGLLGGLVHLLEAIGGVYHIDKPYGGQNIFFSIAELRLHITQMVTAYEKDPTSARLLNSGGYDSLFGRTLGNLGAQVSIRQAINALQAVIFHETYAQPCPLYVPGVGGTVSGRERGKVKNNPKLSFISTTARTLIESIDTIKQDIEAQTAGLTASVLSSRIYGMARTCAKVSQQSLALNVKSARAIYAPAQTTLATAATKAQRWQNKNGKDFFSDDPLFVAPPPNAVGQEIIRKLDEARAQLEPALELDVVVTDKKKAAPARLNQQIFRPDCWFSAPPRCNVLFPEHYTSIQYERIWLREPTRLLLKVSDSFIGEDELFDSFYFAPKALGVKTQSNQLNAILANEMFDHELYTGILPIFEKMGEMNIFAARGGQVQGQTPRVGLAQRSTNFLYFKHRFASRSFSVSARFNPYIACGFPGLIIEKPMNEDELAQYSRLVQQIGGTDRNTNRLLGTHFLGSFTEVEHIIDQQSGRTEIRCSYARQPDESVEFLGQVQREQPMQKRQKEDAARRTTVAAVTTPRVGSVGPNLGEIKEVTEVTSKHQALSLETGQKLPLYQGTRAKNGGLNQQVPVGIAARAAEYGPDIVTFVGDPNIMVLFRAFEILETVPRYKTEMVDLPPEEYIRPGWYGECWHPSQVSDVYKQFFQIGAITEPTQISDHSGTSASTFSSDALAALAGAGNAEGDEDARAQQASIFSLINNRSIEDAVAFLVLVYSYVKRGGLDANQFVKDYTWRPIASMVDMFGTFDLALSEDGKQVVSGLEGFHSRAFGPYEDLFGLVPAELEQVVGVKRGSTAAQRVDKRKTKQDAVKLYRAVLQSGRPMRG